MLRRISILQGHYEEGGQLYAAASILGYFNVSRKPVPVEEECLRDPSVVGAQLRPTQYPRLFLVDGDAHLQLQAETTELDVQNELKIAMDAIIRTQTWTQRNGGALQQRAACNQALGDAEDDWAATPVPGRFLRAAGDAVLQADCTPVWVDWRNTHTCWSQVPVKGHKAQFMHLGTRVLLATATEVPCDQAWPVFIKSADGTWYRLSQDLVSTPPPADAE